MNPWVNRTALHFTPCAGHIGNEMGCKSFWKALISKICIGYFFSEFSPASPPFFIGYFLRTLNRARRMPLNHMISQ